MRCWKNKKNGKKRKMGLTIHIDFDKLIKCAAQRGKSVFIGNTTESGE